MGTVLLLELDASDSITADDISGLITDLRAKDDNAEIREWHQESGMFGVTEVVALVAIGVWGIGQLTQIFAFCQRALHKGVVIDLTATPPIIRKDRELPRGDVVLLRPDHPPAYHRGLSAERVAKMLDEVARSSDPQRFIGTLSSNESSDR